MKYESATNRRLRNPSHAQSLAEGAISALSETILAQSQLNEPRTSRYRVVIGLGPGRSGTKSLAELLSSQTDVVHAEHEMIVPRFFGRDPSGRIDVTTCQKEADDKGLDEAAERTHHIRSNERNTESTNKKKGSWGADRRLEWDAPRMVRGARQRTDEEEALWRVLRLLEQREAFSTWVRDANTSAKGKTGMGKGKEVGRQRMEGAQ